MTKTEIKQMSLAELIAKFYWIAVKGSHEENSRRGITKKTVAEEKLILEELCSRLSLDIEEVEKLLDK